MGRHVRQLYLTLLVWSTSFTTLLATSPHLDCICPDGSKKPFCLRFVLGESMCCVTPCCEPATEAKCCKCQKNKAPEVVKSDFAKGKAGKPAIHKANCEKNLAVSEVVGVQDHSVSHVQSLISFVLDSILPIPEAAVIPLSHSSLGWDDIDSSPPPNDLVVLFQHYLI